MAYAAWSDKQLDLLKKYHAENKSFSQIADLINAQTGARFTKNSCIGRGRRMGLEKRRERNKGGRPRVHANRDRGTTQRIRRKPLPPDMTLLTKFEAIPSPDHLGIAFFDLARHHCRFPKGEGIEATYCGQGVKDDSFWCPYHHAIVYRPPEARMVRRAA